MHQSSLHTAGPLLHPVKIVVCFALVSITALYMQLTLSTVDLTLTDQPTWPRTEHNKRISPNPRVNTTTAASSCCRQQQQPWHTHTHKHTSTDWTQPRVEEDKLPAVAHAKMAEKFKFAKNGTLHTPEQREESVCETPHVGG
jgi:hypothetical protein